MGIPKINRNTLPGNNNTTPSTGGAAPTKGDKELLIKVLERHLHTNKSCVIWGNTGLGKSATVKEFAKKNGLKLIDRKAISLDPLTTAMPEIVNGEGRYIPFDWFKEVTTSDEPMCLFIDEINKFSNPSVQNMLNDILLDRQYVGIKIKDNVFIVGAANFVAESEDATQLDKSILARLTNLLLAPSEQDIVDNMQTSIGKSLAAHLKVKSSGKELFEEEILSQLHKDIPRQLDHIGELCEGVTDRSVVEMIMKGRIGKDATKSAVDHVVRKALYVSDLTTQTYDKVKEMYNSGAKVEVQGLVENCSDSELICKLALDLKSQVLFGAVCAKLGNGHVMKDGTVFVVEAMNRGLVGNAKS